MADIIRISIVAFKNINKSKLLMVALFAIANKSDSSIFPLVFALPLKIP